MALTAPGWGDYPTDAGPALSAVARGDLNGFFAHQPAMGAFTLYVRAPFAALAVALGNSPFGLYRWQTVPCIIALTLVAIWLARFARRRGAGRPAQVLIVGICLLNPLVRDALVWGHPEEILTASLMVASLLAACEQRFAVTGVLAGLAVASKQWAVIVIAPAILILGRQRIRALLLSGAVAGGVSLPMFVANTGAFRHALSYISTPQPVMTIFTWLYPFSPSGSVRITNIFGDDRSFVAHRVWGIESAVSHPLIVALGLGIPALVWLLRKHAPTPRDMLLSTALVLLLRCALDPGSAAYYHLPLVLALVAFDANDGRSLPTGALAALATSFVVLDRFPAYLPNDLANFVYIAAALTALFLLLRALRSVQRAETPSITPDTRPIIPGERHPWDASLGRQSSAWTSSQAT